MDANTTVAEMKDLVHQFCRDRGWEQYHNPKDLALALVCEVGELVEHFRFQDADAVASILADPEKLRAVSHEYEVDP
ncbi:MAG: hypothetical protein JO034_10115 [Singulisphaera sp.]|nr:hypothetical protein [Singulisphaera sp.]